MAQIKPETTFAEMQVGDELPGGSHILEIAKGDYRGRETIRLRCESGQNARGEDISHWYGSQFGDITWDAAIKHSEYMRDTLAYGD